VHFNYNAQTLISYINPDDLNSQTKLADYIVNSDICLGVLTKRGNASIKSMLKVYKLEQMYPEYIKSQQDKT
jgi:hypothetical protein